MSDDKRRMIACSVMIGGLLVGALLLFLQSSSLAVRADPSSLFVTPSGGGDGSQAKPCDLQTALAAANAGDILYLAEGTYTGSGGAVVTVTQSITLYGGWDGSPTGSVVRDPVLYPTTLDGAGQRRVVYLNEGTAPVIDGFIISGGNATALGGGQFLGSEAGGGIYSRNASPTIQNNVITNNVASTLPGVRALGGGIYIRSDATAAVLQNNRIVSNTAGIGIAQGDGGGVFVLGAADILGNTFLDNTACRGCPDASGGGIYVGWTTSKILVAGNRFEGNQARRGGGVALVWSAARVDGNTFVGNTATQNAAGLYGYYDKGSVISANRVISNSAAGHGGGVGIYITREPNTTQLVNNIIAYNEAGAPGGGLYVHSDWNISAVSVTHNTLVANGTGVGVGDNMTATLVNNIFVSHTLAMTVSAATGNLFADHTLFWGNTGDGIRGTQPVDSDPAFADPKAMDYHIGPTSGAIDTGAAAGVVTDIDGDPRPIGTGYDIGADEAGFKVRLPLVVRSP